MWTGIVLGALIVITMMNAGVIEGHISATGTELKYLAVMLLVLIAAMSVYVYRDLSLKAKRRWPFAFGRIEEVLAVRGPLNSMRYVITYSYRVEDRQYSNRLFDFSQAYASKSQLLMHPNLKECKHVSQIEGRMVKVYFNKSNPWQSAISRQLEQSPLITLIPALLVAAYCTVSLVGIFL